MLFRLQFIMDGQIRPQSDKAYIYNMEVINALQIYADISTAIQQAPFLLLSHLLQAIAFSLTLSYLLAFLLSLLHFEYTDLVAENRLTQAAGAFVFWWLRIWEDKSWVVYLCSIFGMVFVSLYVYDCCWNISVGLEGYNYTNRELLILVSYSLMLLSTLVLYWFILKDEEQPLEYQMLGIYILMIALILVGNLLRQRTVISTLLAVLFMNYLIASRHYSHIQAYRIPIYALPFLVMALDAEKKERRQLGGYGHLRIFKLCMALACFGILRNPSFPLEMILGSIFIFGVIINR